MVMIVTKVILVICLLVGITNPTTVYGATYTWPEGWSDTSSLFATGLQGNRFYVEQDDQGISVVSVDGVYQEDLRLAYRLYSGEQLITEKTIAQGRINYPNLLIDDQGIRHLLWQQRADGRYQLVYAKLSADGETLEQTTLLAGSYRIQEPVMARIEDQYHVVWVDNKTQGFQVRHGVISGNRLSLEQAVAVTDKTSVRPAITGDHLGGVHVSWLEVGVGGAELMYSRRKVGSFARPQRVASVSSRMVNDNGTNLIYTQNGIINFLWSDALGVSGSGGFYLHWTQTNSSGNIEGSPATIAPGDRPRVRPKDSGSYHLVWQSSYQGVTQVHYGVLTDSTVTDVTVLNARRASSFRPEFAVSDNGDLAVFWLEALPEGGYQVRTINDSNPRTITWWERMGIDSDSPGLHLAFLVSGTSMLALSYLGINLLVALAIYAALFVFGRFPLYQKNLLLQICVVAVLFMVLQETPIAFSQPVFVGPVYYLLTIVLASLWTLIFVKRLTIGKGFENAVVIFLWMFWQYFYALIPQALASL